MTFVIRILCRANGIDHDKGLYPAYLQAFRPDEHDGRGIVEMTNDIAEAMPFDSKIDAFEFWRAQSTVRPTRDDGKPNRPLTAFTVEIRQVVPASS